MPLDTNLPSMDQREKQVQQIAVFGQSGSGKTVLASSFYGLVTSRDFEESHVIRMTADDPSQGQRLRANFLGMRDDGEPPMRTLKGTSYTFSVSLKNGGDQKIETKKPFTAMQMVWHDYPGEWFEQSASGPTEEERRLETFQNLLGSDLALVLIDGERLREYDGEEERYLKDWLAALRQGLARMKPHLVVEGKKLVQFPRIWMIALSKADLFPDRDVDWFRDLVERKAYDELAQLRETLGEIVEGSDALAVGEDFVLLSSARFEPGKIDVDDRKGIDLILPLAALFPVNRQLKWAEKKLLPAEKADAILKAGARLAIAALGKKKSAAGKAAKAGKTAKAAGKAGKAAKAGIGGIPGILKGAGGAVLGWAASHIDPDVIETFADMAGEKLRELNAKALAKKDYLAATLSGFQMSIEDGEQRRILYRSRR